MPAVAAPGAPTSVSTRAKAELTLQPGLGAAILARVNVVRAMRGLGRVTFSAPLGASAALHSREMATSGRFQHESPDGSPFWKRVEHYYPSSGFRSWDVGETLLWWAPGTTAANAVAAWLASPPHREILLDPKWRQIGVSAIHDTDAPGDFRGLEATIITADFGTRRPWNE